MHKVILLTISLLATPPAFAEDGHFPAPHGAPVAGTAAGPGQAAGLNCNNRAAVTKYLADVRLALRKEYAAHVAQDIPLLGIQSPLEGVRCIHKTEAFDSAHNAADDSFTLTCLAHSQVTVNHHPEDIFSHILQLRMKADLPCLGVDGINNFVSHTDCSTPYTQQTFAQGLRSMVDGMHACAAGFTSEADRGIAPPFMGAPVAYSIDTTWYTELLQHKPSVGNIIDADRRVKGSATTTSGHASHVGPWGTDNGTVDTSEECHNNVFHCHTTPAQ